jgi:hypothetical protein
VLKAGRKFFAAVGRHARRRPVVALVFAGVTLAAAVFLGTAHLKMHGHYHCSASLDQPGSCDPFNSYWVVGRFAWQIPLAVALGAVGLAAAVPLLRRTLR